MVVFSRTILVPPEEASAPIEAIPLELATSETASTAELEPTSEPTPTIVPEATETSEVVDQAETIAPTPTDQPSPTPTLEPTPTSEPLQIFTIRQEDSEVRFVLDEDLTGMRNTVIGRSNQVAGQIAIAYSDLSSVQMGIMQVNARTLATDSEFRNRSIYNEILDTNEFEFITFVPTEIIGLPDSVAVGETVTFEVLGDLTIRDITAPTTFNMTVTVISDSEISGSGSTTVLRETFALTIPNVEGVTNIDEMVQLYIDFVATTADNE